MVSRLIGLARHANRSDERRKSVAAPGLHSNNDHSINTRNWPALIGHRRFERRSTWPWRCKGLLFPHFRLKPLRALQSRTLGPTYVFSREPVRAQDEFLQNVLFDGFRRKGVAELIKHHNRPPGSNLGGGAPVDAVNGVRDRCLELPR
jgi:hypothetical protein